MVPRINAQTQRGEVMANPACSYCGQYEAILSDVSLIDGESQSPCANCLLPHALSLAGAATDGMTIEVADAYAELLDAIYANDPRQVFGRLEGTAAEMEAASNGSQPPPKAPAPSARKSRAKAKAAQVASDGSESDPPVSVELDDPCPHCGSREATGDAHKLTCDGCGAVLATVPDQAG